MESDTDIEKVKRDARARKNMRKSGKARAGKHAARAAAQQGGRRSWKQRSVVFSPLTRVIFLSHLFGLMILIIGSLTLTQYAQGLVDARLENVKSQAELVTSIIADTATGSGDLAELDVAVVRDVVRHSNLASGWRVRVYDLSRQTIADSNLLSDTINVLPLERTEDAAGLMVGFTRLKNRAFEGFERLLHNLPWRVARRDEQRRNLTQEVKTALGGKPYLAERYDEEDRLIVTSALPIARVQHIVGAMVLEANDVEDIVFRQRRAFMPFIGWAVIASLISSIALTMSIVFPLRALTRAADNLSRSSGEKTEIPDFSRRGDEIGDLSLVLGQMTGALSARIDDVANFAADVAHEIKNPLTSLRSASDTLSSSRTKAQRQKLINIIQDDVKRMNRLISDISNASKLDASLARAEAEILDVRVVLRYLCELYQESTPRPEVAVSLEPDRRRDAEPIYIKAFETPFAQVIRNLIDNALTFSPDKGEVTLSVRSDETEDGAHIVIYVEDEGPGIPPDSLERVFDRFYTQRPKGMQFGSHSGLGLAICRQIITAHNGEIFAENRMLDGKIIGARFIIKVPRYNAVNQKDKKKS